MTDTASAAPSDLDIDATWDALPGIRIHNDANARGLDTQTMLRRAFARAVLAKWGTPQQEAQEPCPTCIALARTVMLDQVSFDRKPDCYGIRQITDDEGVEEWEDIRTSPDVAREEANDMMATGRGEIYEVVPLWTTPQPTQAQELDELVALSEQAGLYEGDFPAKQGQAREPLTVGEKEAP